MTSQVVLILRTREDTQSAARAIAGALELPAVLALTGDLGAGKTTFAQDLAVAYGIQEFLPSPTFTLMNIYPLSGGKFIHSDLYRLTQVSEMAELGLSDYFHAPKTVTVIEWADKGRELMPPDTIWIHLELVNVYRVMTIRSENKIFFSKLEKLL